MKKTLLIIGSGIAGLSAGCYGQMNGYRTRIFEMHDKPGGLCTSWKHNGYTIDGCLHWLVGSAPGLEISRIWEELGAVQVEMRDVATPVTFHRYTGNWRGSFEGWLPSPDQFGLRMRKTLPGLDNFYMCGQWVEPGGGIPPAAMSGRNVIQLICKKDKKEFIAGTP